MSLQANEKVREAARLSPLFVDTEFVPTGMNFFTLYHPRISKIPTVLPYSPDQTFQQLQAKLSGIELPLPSTRSSISDYKIQANRKYIDGDQLQIGSDYRLIEPKPRGAELQGKERWEVCCVMLQSIEEVVRPLIQRRTEQGIRAEIIAEISRKYNTRLTEADICFNRMSFSTQTTTENLTNIHHEATPIKSLSELILSNNVIFVGIDITTDKFSPWSFQNSDQVVSAIHPESGRLLRITDPLGKSFMLQYEMIKQYKVQEVLEMLGIQNAERRGLKILEKIVEPGEIIYNLSYLYEGEGLLNFVDASVATERQVFLQGISNILQLSPGELKKLVNQSKHSGVKTNVTAMSHLGIFCSDFEIFSGRETSFKLLYHIINKYIRSLFTYVSNFFDHSISNRFTKGLYSQLIAFPAFEGKAYRRVGFELTHQKGDIIDFSGFIVATANLQVLDLSSDPLYETRYTTITIISKTGRLIQQESAFKNLQQVIFLPFTTFQVIGRSENKYSINLTLEQVVSEPKDYFHNIILWVDKPTNNEPRTLFNVKLRIFPTSIRLVRLPSTEKFVEWIQNNEKIVKSQFTNIIVITNMFRIQNGKQNPNAGAETIRIGRSMHLRANYIAYIGNIQKAWSTLKMNKIDPQSLHIINDSGELEGTLVQYINRGLVRNKQESQVKLGFPKQNWKDFFPQLSQQPVQNKNVKVPSNQKINNQGGIKVMSMKQQKLPQKPNNILIQCEKKIEIAEKGLPKTPKILQPGKGFINSVGSPKSSMNGVTSPQKPINAVPAALSPKKAHFQQPAKPKSTIFQPKVQQQMDPLDRFQVPTNLKATQSEGQSKLYQFKSSSINSKIPPQAGGIGSLNSKKSQS